MALRGTELGVIGYPFGVSTPGGGGGGGPAPAFQHFRTNLAGGFVFVDEFSSSGGHVVLRPNAGIDLTTLAPASWLFPADLPGALDGPRYVQTIHGMAAGLGARAILWSHTKAAATRWDHISIWDPVKGDLWAIVEERTEDGNARVHDAMTEAVWVPPFMYYARVTSVDGSPPTVTITVYRSSAKLTGESSWASRVVPSGMFTGGTVVASLDENFDPVLIVAGDGSVSVRIFVDERAAADAANGTFRYAAKFNSAGAFDSEDTLPNPSSGLNPGFSAPSLGSFSCGSGNGTEGLVKLALPSHAKSPAWPTTGPWAHGGGSFLFASLSPDRVTAAAAVGGGTRKVIWAPADRTSGNPDGDIIMDVEATSYFTMITRDGL